MLIGTLEGGTAESHGETRPQRLHIQHRNGKAHNGQRVGAHGVPHHLINGGDIVFLCADVGTKPVTASAQQQHCKFAGWVFY